MKYLIVSDIHGSLPTLQKVLKFYKEQQCDMLCILGDILNYGPRNGVPEGLDAPACGSPERTLGPDYCHPRQLRLGSRPDAAALPHPGRLRPAGRRRQEDFPHPRPRVQ